MEQPNNRPVPRHDPTRIQLAVEAVKVHLDLAESTMKRNDTITPEDWAWYEQYLTLMLEEARQHNGGKA